MEQKNGQKNKFFTLHNTPQNDVFITNTNHKKVRKASKITCFLIF